MVSKAKSAVGQKGKNAVSNSELMARFVVSTKPATEQVVASLLAQGPLTPNQVDWALSEVECARQFNFELPDDIIASVELLEQAIENTMGVRQSLILVLDEETGVYTCLNDEKNPEVPARELTRISDRFLQELMGTEATLHTHLLFHGDFIGIVAVADKANGRVFDVADEMLLEVMAPYLATKVLRFKSLKQSMVLPYKQGILLDISSRLVAAVDEETIIESVMTGCQSRLGFNICQYVAFNDKTGEGEILYENRNGRMSSFLHAGLADKRKRVRDFAGLVSLLSSGLRKDSYLQVQGKMLGDKSLSEIFHVRGVESALILPVRDLVTNAIEGTLVLLKTQSSVTTRETVEIAKEVSGLASQAMSRAKVLEKALAIATVDELTGLTNRRGFYERFEGEIERARRHPTHMAVVIIDVDHFKRFNDTYGHLNGDVILRTLGEHFTQNLRKSDVVCRFGGEEFTILLPDTNIKAAEELIDRLRRSVEALEIIGVNGEELAVTFSAGVALVDMTQGLHRPAREVISHALAIADEQLYKAKDEGRNRVCVTC